MSTQETMRGTYVVGPDNGTLTVRTSRAGMAARAGHDLLLEATAWTGSLVVDQTEQERSRLELTIDATSFQIREATGGVRPLSESDRAEILKNLAQKVLATDRHSEIRFVADAVRVTGEGAISAAGDLTLAGVTQPVHLALSVMPAAGALALSASVSLLQSRFGIKPFSALMGTLKVADEVTIQADARVGD